MSKELTAVSINIINNNNNNNNNNNIGEASNNNVNNNEGMNEASAAVPCRENLRKINIKTQWECSKKRRQSGSSSSTGLGIKRPPKPVIKVKAPEKIHDKPSQRKVFEEIMKHLRDRDINIIGLRGIVGVGKTAIMKNLNNNKQIALMFKIIIFVTLGEQGNEEKLQQEVARRLTLNIEGTDDKKAIALRISTELKDKRFLLLLDDVCDEINLDDIGIPGFKNGSKVVLACRHPDICRLMKADEVINMYPLSTVEARKLFLQKMGRDTSGSDIDQFVYLILGRCSNLPLVIVTVASAFRKKDATFMERDKTRLRHDWLERLKDRSNVSHQEMEGMDELLERLRFCYEELDEEKKKNCFLYVALHPHDYDIYEDYLLECWKAEGFVDGGKEREALSDLIYVSLLEDGEKVRHVKMNKVIRRMALKILSEDNDAKCLVKVGKELQKPHNEEEWREAKRISLIDNKLRDLPNRPDCRNLSTLLLQRNVDLSTIPEQFFESMQSLRVLNLGGTSISALPLLSYLGSLRALYLNSCNELKELPSEIANLPYLEVLDIRGMGIDILPSQIGVNRPLQCLRMSLPKAIGESMDVDISQYVISELGKMKKLVIDVHSENQLWMKVVRAIAKEVTKSISKSFFFPEADCLEIFIQKSLRRPPSCFTFQFSVGTFGSSKYLVLDYHGHEICKCLKYINGEDDDQPAISEAIAETNAFDLVGYKGSFTLSDFGFDNINKLKCCLIESCSEMETIVNGTGANKSVLECLEKMYISNATKLNSTWKGDVPAGSLRQLTTLKFFKCSVLKEIFSRDLIQQLSNLQHLEVQECHEVEAIIVEPENKGLEPAKLPSLRKLILDNLPKLRKNWGDNLMCPCSVDRQITQCCLLP